MEQTIQKKPRGRPRIYPLTELGQQRKKEDRKAYRKAYYIKNREKFNERTKMHMRRIRADERERNGMIDGEGRFKPRGPYKSRSKKI